MMDLTEDIILQRLDELHKHLRLGADPNHFDSSVKSGFRPLHIAAQQSDIKAASLLLEYNADIEIRNDYGNTPLWVAISGHDKEKAGAMIRFLLERGANPDAICGNGDTPWKKAKGIGNHDMVQFFKGYVDPDEIEAYYEMMEKYCNDDPRN